MAINCDDLEMCGDTCPVYDLCEVTVQGGGCTPTGETRIICEGFKFSSKMDVEVKTNSACYEGYGYQMSNIQYDWEITNPCDRNWFDKQFVAQVCDKYSMQITGYVMTECGVWEKKETLTACVIEETGRDYGKGVSRSIKGKALHRIIHSGKEDGNGVVSNASKSYKRNIKNGQVNGNTVQHSSTGTSKEDQDMLKAIYIGGAMGFAYGGIPGLVGGAVAGATYNQFK